MTTTPKPVSVVEVIELIEVDLTAGDMPAKTRVALALARTRAALPLAEHQEEAYATMLTALEGAHKAIEALIHAENNPNNERIQQEASDLVRAARQSKRDAL